MKSLTQISRLFFAIVIVLLAACQPKPTATPSPAKTEAAPAPTVTSAPSPSNPLDTPWDDRTLFRKGLINAEQDVLNRLPGASVYHIDLQISDDYSSVQGMLQVRYTNQETKPLDEIYFRLFANAIGGQATVSAIKVDGQSVEPAYESQNTAVRVPLAAPLQPGQQVVIQMDFQVQIPRELGGSYGLLSYMEGVLALDSVYPSIPAYDDKGWYVQAPPPNADLTYADVSFYLVRVTAPAKLKVATSGIEISRESKGHHQAVTFAAGPARDFYIAASENYVVFSDTVGETKVNSYAPAERAEAARQALRDTVNAIKKLGVRFGDYPYTEFDVAAISMSALGIEYPGITGITLKTYDLGKTVSGLPASVMLESVIAHEVGHQWFYSTVGNDQVNEPWLDEAVTQYVTGLYYEDMYGQGGAQGYRSSWEGRWAQVNRADIPIGLPAKGYAPNEYGPIVYGRGPIVLMGMAQKMGQKTFDTFLREYYTAHKWSIGTGAAFKQLLERQCQCDLTPIFQEQVYAQTSTDVPFELVSLTTEDNVKLAGTLFPGKKDVAVVLAHMGIATQQSWHPFARLIAAKGFTALALDFRCYGSSDCGQSSGERAYAQDLRAATRFLRERGASRIVCMGASIGGTACANVALDENLAGLVVIASTAPANVNKRYPQDLANPAMPKLFIMAEQDRYAPVIAATRSLHELSPEPKELKIFPGTVHGTELFDTEYGDEFTNLLVHFLERLR